MLQCCLANDISNNGIFSSTDTNEQAKVLNRNGRIVLKTDKYISDK